MFGYIIFFPVIIIIGILIKFEDGGTVFFSQIRIGQNGTKFMMFKFRSMNVEAESFKQALMSKNEIDGKMFKMKEDPRVTRVGRFIRRHSLDEIPQLLNILLGDMSLVGPRPPLEDEVEKYTELEKQRLLVRPGLTGLWQVNGRSNLAFEEMVQLDLNYIEHRNLWLDLKIIFKTFSQLFSKNSDGAF